MNQCKRKITREQYLKMINEHDAEGIFTEAEVCGYGVYSIRPYHDKEKDEYWVKFELGSSCD